MNSECKAIYAVEVFITHLLNFLSLRGVLPRAVEPEPKRLCMDGAGATNFRWWIQPDPGIWVPVPQTIFVRQASCTNNTIVFSFQWTKSLWSRSQKLLDAGAGAKNVELESLKFELRVVVRCRSASHCLTFLF